MQNTINNLVLIIKLGYKKKINKIKVLNTKLIRTFLIVLIQEGIIWGYSIYSYKWIVIKLKQVSQSRYSFNIKRCMFNKNAQYVSFRNLCTNISKNTTSTYMVSTKKGFVTNALIVKHNLGGKLICISS